MPSLSIVLYWFHDGALKVLVQKMKEKDPWGYIKT
jgi:hypothetical protein